MTPYEWSVVTHISMVLVPYCPDKLQNINGPDTQLYEYVQT
jgi:hypothetical protein